MYASSGGHVDTKCWPGVESREHHVYKSVRLAAHHTTIKFNDFLFHVKIFPSFIRGKQNIGVEASTLQPSMIISGLVPVLPWYAVAPTLDTYCINSFTYSV